jgi:hypothetical protein
MRQETIYSLLDRQFLSGWDRTCVPGRRSVSVLRFQERLLWRAKACGPVHSAKSGLTTRRSKMLR